MTITDNALLSETRVRPPSGTQRLSAAGLDADYAAHLGAYGPLPTTRLGADFIDVLEAAGLTGRGGAAFPAWRKLAATDSARASRTLAASPVVIANGAEGEPRSSKDATLLKHAPHLVIDGLLTAAAAVSATRIYLYTSVENFLPVQNAIAERRDARRIKLVEAPDAFVSGEASAVVNAIERGVANPQDRIRRISDSGLNRRPTLVHNVETLAHVALIARFGARWFRSVGTDRHPGTHLVTVSGDVAREGVMEVAGGATVLDLLRICGTERSSLTAVLVGGYHGTWIRADQLPPGSPGALDADKAATAGIIFAIGRHRCGLAATAEILNYLARESARQCGPCALGLPAMATLLTRLAAGGRDRRLEPELRRLSESVVGRGSCHHPDGTSRLVLSALSAFSNDVTQHLSGRCVRSAKP